MMVNPMTQSRLTVAQRALLMKTRMQHGVHFMFTTPVDVLKRKLNFEFAKGFIKNSMLRIVVEVQPNKAMEIQYESTGHQNRYIYFTRQADGKITIGTNHLVYKVHHRYDIKLKGSPTLGSGVHIVTLVHKSNGYFTAFIDGNSDLVDEQVACSSMVECSRVRHGGPFFDDPNSTEMMNFKVYELHHVSDDPKVMFEQISKNKDDNYTLPPFVFLGTGGEVIFSGKFHGRSVATDKIAVFYGGKLAAELEGAPFDHQGWLVLKFCGTRITISLADSTWQAPWVISRFIKNDDGRVNPNDKGQVRAIGIGRNFQLDNVFVYSGMTLTPIQPRPSRRTSSTTRTTAPNTYLHSTFSNFASRMPGLTDSGNK
ncbi:uncharacterized protein [Dermacentor albipictus]|uniref:uncharacterized protein n=1 Tax=Dermacentor albipictus TaxID=60249 RepID=UPI0038FC0BE5